FLGCGAGKPGGAGSSSGSRRSSAARRGGLASLWILRRRLAERSVVDLAATGPAITFSHAFLRQSLKGAQSRKRCADCPQCPRCEPLHKKERPDLTSGRTLTRPPIGSSLSPSFEPGAMMLQLSPES